jgi:hypothetical protein
MHTRFCRQNSMLKGELNHIRMQDFMRFTLFYPEHFSRQVPTNLLGIKIIRVSQTSEFVFTRAMNFK